MFGLRLEIPGDALRAPALRSNAPSRAACETMIVRQKRLIDRCDPAMRK